jgi:hypothetical protein
VPTWSSEQGQSGDPARISAAAAAVARLDALPLMALVVNVAVSLGTALGKMIIDVQGRLA